MMHKMHLELHRLAEALELHAKSLEQASLMAVAMAENMRVVPAQELGGRQHLELPINLKDNLFVDRLQHFLWTIHRQLGEDMEKFRNDIREKKG